MKNAELSKTLKELYTDQQSNIRRRLEEFRSVPEVELFYEIAFCLLTPQTSARSSDKAIVKLKEHNFFSAPFDAAPVLRTGDHYIRFHNTKAKRLHSLAVSFSSTILPIILDARRGALRPQEARAKFLEHVKGFGLKEASHALRNVGIRELAILDRHILRKLVECKVIGRMPVSLTSKRYALIEKKFLRFAERVGIPIDELDLLFWCAATGEIFK